MHELDLLLLEIRTSALPQDSSIEFSICNRTRSVVFLVPKLAHCGTMQQDGSKVSDLASLTANRLLEVLSNMQQLKFKWPT
eukprot:3826424-Amphidinium_carterae.2